MQRFVRLFGSYAMIEEKEQQVVSEDHWNKGLSYENYRALISRLLALNQTTGQDHSEKMIEYTQLNEKRMNKWDKITKISTELQQKVKAIDTKQRWLVLTEAWCGDAAQNLPVIHQIVALNSNIELRLILRDENLDVMDAYLTNGGRSIPKLIMLDEQLNPINTWGPRPAPVQEILKEMKAGDITYDEFAIKAHTWYAKDKSLSLQKEIYSLL